MVIAKLVGHVWSTRKYDSLNGMKLMLVEVMGGKEAGRRIVAVDTIGAGIGDRVLVTEGSTARCALENYVGEKSIPVDAVISGIIDEDCSID